MSRMRRAALVATFVVAVLAGALSFAAALAGAPVNGWTLWSVGGALGFVIAASLPEHADHDYDHMEDR